MKKNDQYQDQGLRKAVQRKNEAAEKMSLPEDFADRLMLRIQQQEAPTKRRRAWFYPAIGIAATIALLFSVGVVLNNQDGEKPNLVAQTDTMKVVPQKENVKKTDIREMADTVKTVKEILKITKPPRHYMAKKEKRTETTPEPDFVDEIALAEMALAEEEQRMAEMILQMNGSQQNDYQEMTREIRQRGERLTQQVEMAISDDTY